MDGGGAAFRLFVIGIVVGLIAGVPTFLVTVQARELHGFRAIGTDLSHKTVHDVIQDSQGYIWVATLDGLNRYDGYEFVTWRHDPDDPESLSSSAINSLLEDRHGRLWVGTAHGLDRIDRESLTVEPDQLGALLGSEPVATTDLVLGPSAVWAATHRGLFALPEGDSNWRSVVLGSGPWSEPAVISMAMDTTSGNLHALAAHTEVSEYRLFVLDAAGSVLRWDELAPRAMIGVSAQGQVWTDSEGPFIASVDDVKIQPDWMWAFANGPDGTTWLGNKDGLIDTSTMPSRLYRIHSDPRNYLGNFVRAILVDDAGELWLGTFDGLYRSLPAFRPFFHLGHAPSDARSLSIAAVASIHEDALGRLWVGTFGGGINRIETDGAVTQFPSIGDEGDRLSTGIVWDIASYPDGKLLLGTSGGLYRFDPDSGRSMRLPIADATGTWAEARQIRFEDGRFWLGTLGGLIEYDGGDHHALRWHPRGPNGEVAGGIESMVLDGDRIWLGIDGGGLVEYRVSDGATRVLELPGGVVSMWDLHLRADGTLLLGTSAGLLALPPDRSQVTPLNPGPQLAGSTVYGILEDQKRRLWLGTNRGLVRWDGTDARTYFASDGTGNIEFNRHAVAELSSGELVFGGMDGLTRFDPLAVADNPRQPPIVFTAVEVHATEGVQRMKRSIERLELSYTDYTFALEFAALDYADPQRNRYRYRLVGFDRDWVEAGGRRRATYTNIPAGSYRFEVQGSNNDGLWNRAGAVLPIQIAPPFWETWWFRAGVAAAVLALITWIYRLRVNYLLRLERVRLQIAGDLHDEIGSDLSGIAIASDVVRREMEPGEVGQEELKEISSIALRTAGNLRDIVWYINPDNDRGRSLRQRMQATAQTLLAEMDYSLEFDEAVDQSELDMGVRRNVHLVFKEALNNIQRHAGASSVRIRARNSDGHLELEVSDDGCGFDPENESTGTGLSSMRKRIDEIGGSLELTSGRDGTRLVARIPLPKTRDGQRGLFGL